MIQTTPTPPKPLDRTVSVAAETDDSDGWIQVNDRLPGFYSRVFIAEGMKGSSTCVRPIGEGVLSQHGDWVVIRDGEVACTVNLHRITHWRPLA
jgi:hypothetical protein